MTVLHIDDATGEILNPAQVARLMRTGDRKPDEKPRHTDTELRRLRTRQTGHKRTYRRNARPTSKSLSYEAVGLLAGVVLLFVYLVVTGNQL